MSRYCRAFVISVFYMADNNGLRTLPEKEYKKAVKFHVEFSAFLRIIYK
jgi:hypothetical protein